MKQIRGANNGANSLFNNYLIHYFDIINSLKSDMTHYILIQQ